MYASLRDYPVWAPFREGYVMSPSVPIQHPSNNTTMPPPSDNTTMPPPSSGNSILTIDSINNINTITSPYFSIESIGSINGVNSIILKTSSSSISSSATSPCSLTINISTTTLPNIVIKNYMSSPLYVQITGQVGTGASTVSSVLSIPSKNIAMLSVSSNGLFTLPSSGLSTSPLM